MKKIITSILIFITSISFIACDSKTDTTPNESKPIINQQEETDKTSLTDFYIMVELDNTKIELGVFPMYEDFTPIKLYKEQPIELVDKDKELIKQNLSGTVWEDIEFVKPDVDGLISLKTAKDKGEIISRQENHQFSQEFIDKSGLIEIFSNKGIDFKIDESSIDKPSTMYFEYKDGEFMTNSYMRLDFYKDKNLSQCKIYAMKSEHYKTLDRIYVDDAINNPCFAHYKDAGTLKQQKTLKVVGAKITYSHLVPLYAFTIKVDSSADEYVIYTPCISNQEISNDEILYNQFLRFLTEGVIR